jgi:6-phosphofructokinase 1
MVARDLKMRCRSETPGLLGRSSIAHRSAQDLEDATAVGAAGVAALTSGRSGSMVALTPLGSAESTTLVSLDQVAGIERPLPGTWLDRGSLAVNQNFCRYLRPLVGELPEYAAELAATTLMNSGVC